MTRWVAIAPLYTALLSSALLFNAGAAAQAPGPALSSPDAWLTRQSAELVVLDKVRARPTVITLRVGQSGTAGPLTILVRRCVTRPADVPPDSAAFLDIQDRRSSVAFHGWMLANGPALGQLEHPIYDVRLTGCR